MGILKLPEMTIPKGIPHPQTVYEVMTPSAMRSTKYLKCQN